jgi:hypothetical protein
MIARFGAMLLLFGMPNRRLDAVLSGAVAAMVGLSRFALLAEGPWEWDETLFARGILHFELAAHFPHPPGFPGWLALGHLLTPLTGDPLRALQLASAAFSVAALWVLAALGRRVAPPVVAVSAALLVLAAPGPWLYAVRGFSSSAAAVLALAAAALLAGRLEGWRVSLFTLLVTAAALVRPILLPAFAVLWVAGASTVRPRRLLLPGLTAGLSVVVIAVAMMARAEGGWGAFVAPFVAHSQRHFSRLVANPGGYSELGLVKGLGGVVPASVLFALAAWGLVAWARRYGRRVAALWLAVVLVAAMQLVWLQNRTYGRYAVGVQMALAPLLAGAATSAPPVAAGVCLFAAAAWYAAGSLPLVLEQHSTELPGWSAVKQARADALAGGRTVVLEPELHPFASYLWHLCERRGQANPPWVLSPWAPEPWRGVDGPWVVATVHRHLYPAPLYGFEEHFSGVSAALEPMTQQRFLEASVIADPPLPLGGWWPAESTPEGRRFMWGGSEAELLVPPLSARAELGLAVRPVPGPQPLEVAWEGRRLVVLAGEGGEELLWIPPPATAVGKASRLLLRRAAAFVPGPGDPRPLAVQLFELRAVDPGRAWSGAVARPRQRAALRVRIEGAFAAERFSEGLDGVWLGPRAAVSLPAATGVVRLRMWAPRPTPPETEIWLAGRRAAGPLELGPRPRDVTIELDCGDVRDGRAELLVTSVPYRPSEHGSDDHRELGVVLSDVAFEPAVGDLD